MRGEYRGDANIRQLSCKSVRLFIIAVNEKTIMGRPPTRPKGFRDGFYIEIVNRGMSQTMKPRSDSREEMERNAAMYAAAKKHGTYWGSTKRNLGRPTAGRTSAARSQKESETTGR
ncbi:MAG: hypothetical protein IPH78_14030 [Bacteroidetes bacterium]|nr:hypothetical protein [Bacteroidota bacterium]